MRKGKLHAPEMRNTKVSAEKLATIDAVKFEYLDGDVIKTKVGRVFPMPEQEIFAKELCVFLNKEIAHGGRWRVVLTQPAKQYYDRLSGIFRVAVPQLYECQFLDKDGDAVLVVDLEEDVWDLLDNFSFTDIAQHCETTYHFWRNLEANVGIREDQKYSPAHGQVEKNAREVIPGLMQ